MIKRSIKSYLYKRGYYLRTVGKNMDELKWLTEHNISTIIDIGAHKGESYYLFRKIFPNAAYNGFEPITHCFNELKKATSNDKNAEIFPYAVSDTDGKSTFYLTDNSYCSSLLKPEENTGKDYAGNYTEQQVELKRLDSIFAQRELKKEILIKIDVQGAEESVLSGGKNTLCKAKIVIIEISFEPLYQHQPDFSTIYQFMKECGFKYTGAFDQFVKQTNGKVMQQDAIFVRA
jgi:FkbM family methyltransferase